MAGGNISSIPRQVGEECVKGLMIQNAVESRDSGWYQDDKYALWCIQIIMLTRNIFF